MISSHQLIYGIRYLDIRAGFNDHTAEKFWTMHDFVAMNPMYKVRLLITSYKDWYNYFWANSLGDNVNWLETKTKPENYQIKLVCISKTI